MTDIDTKLGSLADACAMARFVASRELTDHDFGEALALFAVAPDKPRVIISLVSLLGFLLRQHPDPLGTIALFQAGVAEQFESNQDGGEPS